MKYVADDGQVFETERECRAYEENKKEQDTERDRDYKQLKDAEMAYESAKRDYLEALADYNAKYGQHGRTPELMTFGELLSHMLSI